MKLLLATLVFLFSTLAADAQSASNISSYGSNFYLGFYEHVHTGITHKFYVHTKKTSTVSFSVSSLDGIFSYSGTTSYRDPAVVSIPSSYEVRDGTDTYRRKGLRVSSLETEPISVVAWSYRSSADYMSYLALPCHEQPTTTYTYYVVSTYGWSTQKSQFLIIGCVYNTSIMITPTNSISVPSNPQVGNSPSITVLPGQSYNFTLNILETFFVSQSYVDLTGTQIVSNKPLTIISGHEAAQVPAGVLDADPIVTQLTPTITWGQRFLLAPHHSRANGQSYKILALNNETSAVQTCAFSTGSPNVTNIVFDANNTQWIYTPQGSYCSIISSEPIYIAQIGVSSNYAQRSSGDPALYTVPPMEQYEHEIQFTSFPEASGYYSVVVPNDTYFSGTLMINGFLQNISFVSIYSSNGSVIGYGYSRAASGSTIVSHPHPQGRLFVSVYGWTTYGGYGYPGGMLLNPINGGGNLTLSIPEISFSSTEYTANEGDGMVYVYLETKEEVDSNVTVRLYSNPTLVDTAQAGQDYSSFSVVVTFGAGETLKSVSVPIIDDQYAEPTQYFTIGIENLGDDVTFPITEAVIKIIDNDAIEIGFLDSQFPSGYNGALTVVNVGIVSGFLEPDSSLTFMLEIVIAESTNSSFVTGELSSLNPMISFGFNLSQLSTYDPYSTNQSIGAQLTVPTSPVNITLGIAAADIVGPVIPVFPSSSFSPSSSTMMNMYSSSMIVCYTTDVEVPSSTGIASSSSSSIATSSSSVSSNVPVSISIITVATPTYLMTTVMETIVQTATVCPSVSNTPLISISTTTVTATTTVSGSSMCSASDIQTTRSLSVTPTPSNKPASGNALTEKIEVVGSALYFGIAVIVIAVIIMIALSIFCCVYCYKRGHEKGRISEIKFEREIEMAGNNPLYDETDTMSYRSSVASMDDKKLMQFMQ